LPAALGSGGGSGMKTLNSCRKQTRARCDEAR
jgi:hypothetical protein